MHKMQNLTTYFLSNIYKNKVHDNYSFLWKEANKIEYIFNFYHEGKQLFKKEKVSPQVQAFFYNLLFSCLKAK